MQQAAFDACGLPLRYERWPTTVEELPERIASLRAADVLGANVTIPHKERVIPLLDELGDASARVGAVNTIVNRDGRLFGFNTDGPGFVTALRREAGRDPAGASVLLVGAGGAARGIGFALLDARVGKLGVWNRTRERAERLAADFVRNGLRARVTVEGDLNALDGYEIVVNCTAVGMTGTGTEQEVPFDPAATRSDALVVDIVYVPLETALLARARACGRAVLGGLPMLVYQGALAFELWTGLPAPLETMFEAARAAIVART